jgi:hypothetical protein
VSAPAIVIHPHRLSRSDGWARIEARVDNLAATDRVWFAVEEAHADHLEQAGPEAFLLAVLPIAIRTGQDVQVTMPLSTRLFYSVDSSVIPILVGLSAQPATRVRVLADDLTSLAPSTAVATPFSGGIDSFATVAEHHFSSVPEAYRLTHLTYHNVGSHGLGTSGDTIFGMRRSLIGRAAAELGLPLVLIDSNLHYFMRGPFTDSHTVRQIAAAHAMSGLFGKFLLASGAGYTELKIERGDAIGHTDAALVHVLSSEAMECISSGSQYTRAEKTELVSEIAMSYRYLDVCVDQHFLPTVRPNCSACKKCARTMAMLDILGKLDRYGAVFDLDAWRRDGARRLAPALGKGDAFSREIVREARRHRYRIPMTSRILGLGWRLAFAMPRPTRRNLRTAILDRLRRNGGKRRRSLREGPPILP